MAMEDFPTLGTLLPRVKQKVIIATPLFWLHSFTAALLLCLSVLAVTARLLGDPIACTYHQNEMLKESVVNSYCWMSSFTLPKNYYRDSSVYGQHGLGNSRSTDEKVYHAYYQWVPLVLFLQAFVFYVPHWLWKSWEGGKVAAVTLDLNSVVMDKKERKQKTRQLAEYLHSSLHHHTLYAIKFLFCDVLNVIITLVNICLMNEFLGGKFISYGIEVLFGLTNEDDNIDPMATLFPRVTKCTFRPGGPSGTLQRLDILCVLPHNIIYARMYLFLWAWFWVLLASGVVEIAWRCLVFFVPAGRRWVLQRYVEGGLQKRMENMQYGDFFLLYLLQRNLGSVVHSAFSELVKELSDSKTTSENKGRAAVQIVNETQGGHNQTPEGDVTCTTTPPRAPQSFVIQNRHPDLNNNMKDQTDIFSPPACLLPPPTQPPQG